MNDAPTEQEIHDAAQTLARLPASFLPYEIFVQIARLAVMSILEVVPLRIYRGHVQVLMIKRPADDKFWANLWHTPGSVVRPDDGDGAFTGTFARIHRDELASVPLADGPHYVHSELRTSNRGVENARIFYVEVVGEPPVGTFYDIDHLPDDMITSQRGFINLAAQQFQLDKAKPRRWVIGRKAQKRPR